MNEKQLYDNSGGRLQIRSRSFVRWMVMIISFWPFLFKLISELPGVLGYLKYLPDGILVVLLILSTRRSNLGVRRCLLRPLLTAGGFLLYALLVYIFQYQSIAYFLWGFRNNFRFYVAFFAFIAYFDKHDLSVWFDTVDVLFWVNAVLSVYQFVVIGVYGDFLGGIFGITGASNGYTMLLLVIVISRSVLRLFNQTEKLWVCVAKCITALLLAAMAELKVFYLLFIALLLVASWLTKFSRKKLVLLLCAAVFVVLGASIFSLWYENINVISLEFLWDLATKENYSEQNDVNRLTAIATLARTVVTNPLDQIFGLGLGNCDTSAFAVCNTPFYQQYSYLHYTWFVSAMIFMETGFVGVIIYLLFFGVCIAQAYRMMKNGVGIPLNNQLTIVVGLACFALFFYNASLRVEPGYMAYFILALPFMRTGQEGQPAKGRMVTG